LFPDMFVTQDRYWIHAVLGGVRIDEDVYLLRIRWKDDSVYLVNNDESVSILYNLYLFVFRTSVYWIWQRNELHKGLGIPK